jgi:DNA repair protein RecO
MIISKNGFLVHSRKYQETSSIIYVLFQNKGIQSLIFKGKYNNKDKFKFSLFNEYLFTYNDKYNFPYLSKFEGINNLSVPKKHYLLGLYINELLYKTLKEGYDYEIIYEFYKSFLVQLSSSSSSSSRLAMLFEKNLLDNLGYGLHMGNDSNIMNAKPYIYDFNEGFKIADNQHNKYIIHGDALKDFFANTLVNVNDINLIRFIMKKTFKQYYPDIDFLGDKLF